MIPLFADLTSAKLLLQTQLFHKLGFNPTFEKSQILLAPQIGHNVPQSISPTLKYWRHPFLPSPPPSPRKKSKSVRPSAPPPYEQPPSKIDFSFEMYPHPKKKTRFLKKQKILFPTTKYEYIVAKSRNQRRNDFFYFISAWWLVTDLMGIFNADSRKSVKNHYKLNLKQQGNKETSKL